MTGCTSSLAWVAVLRVRDDGAARKLIFRIRDCLNLELQLGEVKRYWKDETLYRCAFNTPVPVEHVADQTESILAVAQRLAPSWQVSGSAGDGSLEGIATDRIAVSGVTWLSFAMAS